MLGKYKKKKATTKTKKTHKHQTNKKTTTKKTPHIKEYPKKIPQTPKYYLYFRKDKYNVPS